MKAVLFFLSALLCAAPLAWAHDGEDHGTPSPAMGLTSSPPAVSQSVAPRASAKSEDFELLLVADKQALVIYLDSFASNAPVPGAKIEVDGAGLKGLAAEVAPGVYQLAAPALGAGKHALTVSIETADNADLLATTLEIAPGADAAALASPAANGSAHWMTWGLGGVALVLALVLGLVAGIALSRRRGHKEGAA